MADFRKSTSVAWAHVKEVWNETITAKEAREKVPSLKKIPRLSYWGKPGIAV